MSQSPTEKQQRQTYRNKKNNIFTECLVRSEAAMSAQLRPVDSLMGLSEGDSGRGNWHWVGEHGGCLIYRRVRLDLTPGDVPGERNYVLKIEFGPQDESRLVLWLRPKRFVHEFWFAGSIHRKFICVHNTGQYSIGIGRGDREPVWYF